MKQLDGTPQNTGRLKYITKKNEYNALKDLIKSRKLAIGKHGRHNMMATCKALDIDRKTLKSWLNTPEIRDIIRQDIEYYLENMMEAGKDDWRQWKAQIDLASDNVDTKHVSEAMNITIISNDNTFEVLAH